MLDNIVKYNAIRLQESLNEYLKGMMSSLQESSVGFNECDPEFIKGFETCMSLMKVWLDYKRGNE